MSEAIKHCICLSLLKCLALSISGVLSVLGPPPKGREFEFGHCIITKYKKAKHDVVNPRELTNGSTNNESINNSNNTSEY